jgi:rhamnosyltransferase subunit B
MRVLIVATGSHGDINPYIAIGRALKARGHEAAFVANPYFMNQAVEAGLEFVGIGETFELRDLKNYPDVMHPTKGGKVVINDWLLPFADDVLRLLPSLLDSLKPDVVVHHHIAMSVPWACERKGMPCVNCVLSPMMWMNHNDIISPMAWTPQNPPKWFRWLFRRVGMPLIRWQFNPPINKLRAKHGLPPLKDCWKELSRGGAVCLGLWSPVLRPPLPGDPENGVICGFARHDRHGAQEHPTADLERFLAKEEPPILFSLGTAAVHVAGEFYHDAAEACRILGRRGMLLIANTGLTFEKLPQGVETFTYVPFSQVMARVAASVHHGGIGTTGQAMAAGRPTVVVPHAHDQYDNAARVKRLGISETLRSTRVTPERLAGALRGVLEDPSCSLLAGEVARKMVGEDGAGRAAAEIERVCNARRS